MMRTIAVVAFGSAVLACAPALAQGAPGRDRTPELEGAPAPPTAPAPKTQPAPRPSPRRTQATPAGPSAEGLAADAARLARQADAQKAEADRLKKLTDDLAARQVALDARADELAEKERRHATQAASQQAGADRQLADLRRQRDDLVQERDDLARRLAEVSAEDDADAGRQYRFSDLDIAAAQRTCARLGRDEARARNFYSAGYDDAPDIEEGRTLVLRGVMRLEGRRGYSFVDTACEVDQDGEGLRFAFLR